MAESHFVRRCTCKDFIVAREGMEQRIVPTGMAVRDNEVKRHVYDTLKIPKKSIGIP